MSTAPSDSSAEHGCRPGIVLNPASPLNWLDHVLDRIDMVLLMSVNRVFGGQSFIPSALPKIARVREMIDRSGREIRLEVDGGVKVDNIEAVAAAGADTFVAGSAIFDRRTTARRSPRCTRKSRKRSGVSG